MKTMHESQAIYIKRPFCCKKSDAKLTSGAGVRQRFEDAENGSQSRRRFRRSACGVAPRRPPKLLPIAPHDRGHAVIARDDLHNVLELVDVLADYSRERIDRVIPRARQRLRLGFLLSLGAGFFFLLFRRCGFAAARLAAGCLDRFPSPGDRPRRTPL